MRFFAFAAGLGPVCYILIGNMACDLRVTDPFPAGVCTSFEMRTEIYLSLG